MNIHNHTGKGIIGEEAASILLNRPDVVLTLALCSIAYCPTPAAKYPPKKYSLKNESLGIGVQQRLTYTLASLKGCKEILVYSDCFTL
jgi:hypothetical protein